MSPCFVFSSVTTYRKDEQKLGNTWRLRCGPITNLVVKSCCWASGLHLGKLAVSPVSPLLAMNMNFREKILVLEPAVLISPF